MRKLKLNVLTLLLSSLVLLGGCKNGPKLVYYIADTEGLWATKKLMVEWKSADGYQCASPDDTRKALRACKFKKPMPALNICMIKNGKGLCTNGDELDPGQMVNWACLDEYDSEEFLLFCKRRAS
jgi:hypothetical protein